MNECQMLFIWAGNVENIFTSTRPYKYFPQFVVFLNLALTIFYQNDGQSTLQHEYCGRDPRLEGRPLGLAFAGPN